MKSILWLVGAVLVGTAIISFGCNPHCPPGQACSNGQPHSLNACPCGKHVAPATVPAVTTRTAVAPAAAAGQRWFHVMIDLSSDESLARYLGIIERAAKAGYNGMVVHDPKLARFEVQDEHFFANMRKFRQAARDNKIGFIACVMAIGYAGKELATEPNLLEGMPVRNATFVVKDGKLVPHDADLKLENGSFEAVTADGQVAGWQVDAPGKTSFADDGVASDGKRSLRQEDPARNDEHARGRIWQKVAVKPWHYYHVTAMVKTQDCTSKDFRLMALSGELSGGMVLNWQPPTIKPTQDWTKIHATFNSLDNTQVQLMLGAWGGKTGKVWFDDLKIEPGGFVNIIRRDSLPLKVASLDGKASYEEGRDFDKVVDAKLMNDPEPGLFGMWHEAPVVKVPAGSRLTEGQKVLVSYHFGTNCGKDFQVNVCFAEPKLYELMERRMKWYKENLQPDMYMMSHDEIRHLGWDDSCVKTGKTCGQMLADNVGRCTAIIEKVDPGKSIFMWSDMFDPHHNARKTQDDGAPFRMYLARGEGPWYGSWEGLGKQVGIVNWTGGKDASYEWFSKRGHQQIFSGQDPEKIAQWLKQSGSRPGTIGVQFVNWESNYANLEKYIEAVKAWEEEVGYPK